MIIDAKLDCIDIKVNREDIESCFKDAFYPPTLTYNANIPEVKERERREIFRKFGNEYSTNNLPLSLSLSSKVQRSLPEKFADLLARELRTIRTDNEAFGNTATLDFNVRHRQSLD